MKDGTLVTVHDLNTDNRLIGYVMNWKNESFELYQGSRLIGDHFQPGGMCWIFNEQNPYDELEVVVVMTQKGYDEIQERAVEGYKEKLTSKISRHEMPFNVPIPGAKFSTEFITPVSQFLDELERFADIRKKLID